MKKIQIMSISLVAAIFLFFFLNFLEKRIINYEPKIEVVMATCDIPGETLIKKDMVKVYKVPLELGNEANIKLRITDVEEKYSKNDIRKGEILLQEEIGTKEELKILDIPNGMEAIAVKIKNPENGVGYNLRTGSNVNLYFTGKSNSIKKFFPDKLMEDNEIYTIKILNNIKILGLYDDNGLNETESNFKRIDTAVFGVNGTDAEIINNLRNQGTFDITSSI